MIGEGAMDIRLLKVVPDNEEIDMELVTVVLLSEGLGHCMVVLGWHMAYREEMSKAPNRPEFILPASRLGFIPVLVVFGNFS